MSWSVPGAVALGDVDSSSDDEVTAVRCVAVTPAPLHEAGAPLTRAVLRAELQCLTKEDAEGCGPLTRAALRVELRRFAEESLVSELRAVGDRIRSECRAELRQGHERISGELQRAVRLGTVEAIGEADAPEPPLPPRPASTSSSMPLLPLRRPNGPGWLPGPRPSRAGGLAARPVRPSQPPEPNALPCALREASSAATGEAWTGRGAGARASSPPRRSSMVSRVSSALGRQQLSVPTAYGAAAPAAERGVCGGPPSVAIPTSPAQKLRLGAIGCHGPALLEDDCVEELTVPGSETPRATLSSEPSRLGLGKTFSLLLEGIDGGARDCAAGGPAGTRSAADVLRSNRFDAVISAVIVINAICIGLEADFTARALSSTTPLPFRVAELLFCCFFTAELALRLYVHRLSFLMRWEAAVLWNWFDFAVVMLQLFQEAITLAAAASLVGDLNNWKALRVLRLLRIVRIFRLVRVLHLISELRRIVSSIMGSFKSLGWTMVLLALMMYIVGVFFTQCITDHLIDRQGQTLTSGEAMLRHRFGSLSDSVLSLWKSISGGVDWDNIATPLQEEVGVAFGYTFAAYIAFAILALMNVVTGVFVQTALQSAQQEEDSFLTSQIVALLSSTGGDGNTLITLQEILDRLDDPLFKADWKAVNIRQDEAEYIFDLLDVTQSGEIFVEEFVAACIRLRGGANSIDVLTMMQESRHNSRRLDEVFAATCALKQELRRVRDGQLKLVGSLEQQRCGPGDLDRLAAAPP